MVDAPPTRIGVFATLAIGALDCPAAELRPLPAISRFVFRGREAAVAAAGVAFGIDLPLIPCRAAIADARAALWLGPDEWLLIAPEQEEADITESFAGLAGLPHSLVVVSHRNAGLEIAGPRAATVLASGCPLDLHPDAFPVGMCTRTVLGKAEIVLWRTTPETFRIEVWRSFASYVWHFLDEARGEFR